MKNLKSILGLAMLSVAVLACGPKGQTVETSEAQDVASSEVASSVAVNTEASIVTWIGSRPARKHNGTIAITGGEVLVEGEAVVGGNFTFDINSLSVLDIPANNENNAKLRGHLMSADFFDAASFPEASFEITGASIYDASSLAADKDEFATDNAPAKLSQFMVDNPTHFISGNLTMRGTSKNITFPARVTLENGTIKAVANFNIDRTDWKLMYGDEASATDKAKDSFIYNTVNVGFELEAGSSAMANAGM